MELMPIPNRRCVPLLGTHELLTLDRSPVPTSFVDTREGVPEKRSKQRRDCDDDLWPQVGCHASEYLRAPGRRMRPAHHRAGRITCGSPTVQAFDLGGVGTSRRRSRSDSRPGYQHDRGAFSARHYGISAETLMASGSNPFVHEDAAGRHHQPISITRELPLLTGYNRVKRTARFPVNTRESWRFRDVRGRPETA